MGTHPIFESDFDCLTGEMADNHKGAFEAALAAARAAAQKFRDEGKLPAEEKYVAPVAPQGSQQIVATGGQEYRDLGLSNAYRRHSRAITDGSETGNGGYGGGGSRFDSPSSMSRFAGPAIGRGGGSGGAAFNRPQREFGSDTFTKESYNNSFTKMTVLVHKECPTQIEIVAQYAAASMTFEEVEVAAGVVDSGVVVVEEIKDGDLFLVYLLEANVAETTKMAMTSNMTPIKSTKFSLVDCTKKQLPNPSKVILNSTEKLNIAKSNSIHRQECLEDSAL